MIEILFSLLWLTPVFLGIGYVFRKFSFSETVSGYILHGILCVIFLWAIIAFFAPLNIWVEMATLLFGLFFFFKDKLYLKLYKLSFPKPFYFIFLSLLAIVGGSFAPFILDHFGYYVPTIEWIKAEGWPKGVANLEWVLGQMSFWHLLQAGFSNFSDIFLRLNTLFLIYFLLYAFEKRKYVLLLFTPISLLFLQSPSPDLAVILFSLILVNEVWEGNKNYQALFTLSVFIFVIKPTMIWTPIFLFLYLLKERKISFKYWLVGAGIGILFLVKNSVVSGYPLFPTSMVRLSFPWTAEVANLEISSRFALMKAYDMVYSYEFLLKQNVFQKALLWLTLPGIKGFLNVFFVISWLIFIVFCIKKKSKIYFILGISLFVKTIFVLIFSAQYRFFIDVLVVFYSLFFWNVGKKVFLNWAFAGFLAIIGCLSVPKMLQKAIPSFRLSGYMQGFAAKQWLCPSHYEYKKYKNLKLGNVNFHVVLDYPYIFDVPIPAVSVYNLEEYLEKNYIPQYLDVKNKSGFYPKKITAEEKDLLRREIEKYKGKSSP